MRILLTHPRLWLLQHVAGRLTNDPRPQWVQIVRLLVIA